MIKDILTCSVISDILSSAGSNSKSAAIVFVLLNCHWKSIKFSLSIMEITLPCLFVEELNYIVATTFTQIFSISVGQNEMTLWKFRNLALN